MAITGYTKPIWQYDLGKGSGQVGGPAPNTALHAPSSIKSEENEH